ncbi:MAG TPA: hypothetical protein VGI45_04325 [Terracidiphilus sp.]|jgi:hypothetical protein
MKATRREFIQDLIGGTVGVAVADRLGAESIWQKSSSDPGASFGSGRFGTWIEDEFGLPAYRYTMNQVTDPHATTDVLPGVLGKTEHIHQVGNDRITAIASNYGHVRVRQDEGSPEFLNDVDPETKQFGGGFGYLIDGDEVLSTYYDGGNREFERIFGIGYYRKRVEGQSCSIDQVICAPFGDDPVLVSQATVTNHDNAARTVRWVEYWGCQPYQFSYRAALEGGISAKATTELRRDLGRRFSHQVVRAANGRGLLETKHFNGRSPDEEAKWKGVKAYLHPGANPFLAPVADLRPGTEFESTDLPRTFLVSLDGEPSGVTSGAGAFFGDGGAASPGGVKQSLDKRISDGGAHTGLLIERTLHLAPKQTQTVSFLYGYLPQGFTMGALVAKYEANVGSLLRRSSEEWKRHGMRFDVPAEPWIKRESTWNHYYVRSSQTFDDYFGEHILNQNGYYQYTMGFQGAARDPLQHSMPFLFSDPEIVKSVMRYTLKEVRDDGSLPYGIVGHGVVAPMASDNASDLPMWLLWTASEYVLATRDMAFLEEKIPTLFSAIPGQTESVRSLLERCYRHQVNDVGVGEHGVMRMRVDDWNDGLIYTWGIPAFKECVEKSESVLNSAMAGWLFDYYSHMLDYAGGEASFAKEVRRKAEQHREATKAQWNGKWFKRAWLAEKLGWLGDSTLWIEPQPWAILSGATTEEQTRELVRAIDQKLRRGPLGAAQMADGPELYSTRQADLGTLEAGAIWPSLNQTLVWALMSVDPAMAWEEWKRNSLAHHAEAYPDLWYGVWSGNDSWNSPLSKHPGAAASEVFFHGIDFPVLNVHAHACSLYSASKLLGMEFTGAGMKLNLALPVNEYRFDSPLVGVVRTGRRFEGWYAPSRAGEWTIEVRLPADVAKSASQVEVNGKRSRKERREDGVIVVSGLSAQGRPLRWIVEA